MRRFRYRLKQKKEKQKKEEREKKKEEGEKKKVEKLGELDRISMLKQAIKHYRTKRNYYRAIVFNKLDTEQLNAEQHNARPPLP